MNCKTIFKVVGVAVAVSATLFIGCSNDDDDRGGRSSGDCQSTQAGCVDPGTNPDGGGYKGIYGTVSHGGQSYKTVKIGNQTWMAENLSFNVSGSKCYGEGGQTYDSETDDYSTLTNNEVQANCNKYGRLYDWATAVGGANSSSTVPSGVQGICPAGWHLPSDAEWETLVTYVGGSSTAGGKLKLTSGWYNNGNGMNEFGFSALPGGNGNSGGYFGSVGSIGYWWSTTEGDGNASNNAWIRGINYDGEGVFRTYIVKATLFSVRCLQD